MKRYINIAVKVLNSVKEAFVEANKVNAQNLYFMVGSTRMWL